MAQQTINVGTQANDRQGDPLRTAFQKINNNFTELYTLSDSNQYTLPTASTTILGGVKVDGTSITIASDGKISAVPSTYTLPTAGTGSAGILGGVKVDGTSIVINGQGVISSTNNIVATNLDDLIDVAITSPSNGQVLRYNGTNWVNGPDATGDPAGNVTSYNDLTDRPTIPTSIFDLDVPEVSVNLPGYLKYSGTTLSWESALGVTSYNDLTDKPELFSGSYTDLSNKPTIPTSFSSLVNGSYTVSLGATGDLTLPIGVSIDSSVSPLYPKIIADSGKLFSVQGQGNSGSVALSWTVNPDAASQYAAVAVSRAGGDNLAKVILQAQSDSGNVATAKTWQFNETGTLTLPAGGTIVEGGGLTGAIKLTPAGGANEYQALVIYPTGTADGDHIHLTAGGGTTDLYLGDDSQYVKIEHGGNVVIQSVDGASTNQWLFGTDGDLTAPRNIILNNPVTTVTESVTGTVADSTANPFTFRILKSANPQLVIPFADPNFVLKWTGSDAGSVAAAAQAPGGQGASSLVSDDGTYWNFNSWFGLNQSRPNSGTVFTVEYGVVVSDTTISTTDTNLVIEADTKQYRFGTDGNITFPDSTVQTTAYKSTSGSWTLATGSNTVSITVPLNGNYQMWVNGNIPNGIVEWNATVNVSNPNVPAIGSQYAWYYAAGNALVLTAIPNQIVGTAGVISTSSSYVGNTANVFTFGITNNSLENAVVNWGYVKLS